MTKTMLIDATHAEETRVAVVSGNKLEEFDFESTSKKQLKGNVYLAKVTRVEPSLQAAFIDYGGNRHGFLASSEIHPDYYQIPISDREKLIEADSVAEEAEEPVDGASVEVVGGDEMEEEVERRRPKSYRNYKIQEVIKRRQIMLVQVVKEERGNKGAALTTYLSLAGRYCVLMPNTARGGGISRKIASAKDRKRLKGIVDGLDIPSGMAVIVRTAGADRSKAEIKRDYEYLMRQWDTIRTLTLESTAPCLINEEGNLIKRSIRDLYSKEIDQVLVEGDAGYRLAKDFMKSLIPSHATRVKQYKNETVPVLHRYQVESQIDAIHNPIVQLRSGGYLVINPTEALVAIDVNSGRSTKERNIEETAYKTNMETAEEVARQLRLRDLAGLIVIDFIDMENSRNIHAVERKLKDSLKDDRARIQVGRISPFGLMEMSRQRLRPSVTEASSELCPVCGGIGHIRSTESAALHALRALEEEGVRKPSGNITLHVSTKVALYILNQKRATLTDIESRYSFAVTVAADEALVPPEFRLDRVRQPGDEDVETPQRAPRPARNEDPSGENAPRKRRSRRRRPQRDDQSEQVVESAESDNAEADNASEPSQSDAPETNTADEEAPRKRSRRGRRGGRRRGRPSQDVQNQDGTNTMEAANDDASPTGGETPLDEAEPVAANDTSAAEVVTTDAPEAPEAPAATDDASEATSDDQPVVEAREPKTKRPRRRRRATKATEDATVESGDSAESAPATTNADGDAGATTEVDETETTAEAPKRPRRRRAKAKPDDAPATETPATDEQPVVEQPAASELAAATVASVEASPVEDTPVETPEEPVAAEEEKPTGPPKPKRGGWWQKVLG
ncbi:MAG: ribonuclease E/G [Rhodospirillaceae bacterium]|jgi:ribonuclease E|nr:ribonuclease E/G [Rhodospirillaceae bacterium]